MVYAEAVQHLAGLGPELAAGTAGTVPPRKFDLAHMRTLCAFLGDPQKTFPSVLIAGTNGKGSTAATLASISAAAGYRTALYTSPHLTQVNERIQVTRAGLPSEYGSQEMHGADGELKLGMIGDDDFGRLYSRVDDACEELLADGRLPLLPSFFERLTALAFLYFAEQRVELAVLEVGLGGRLDATNVVEPRLAIITDIALDHQEYLGDTIAAIAGEKCGILRRDGTLVTLPQLPEANTAIGLAATALNVHGISAAEYMPPARRNDADTGVTVGVGAVLRANRYVVQIGEGAERTQLTVDSPLPGVHQQRNIALAIAAAIALRNSNKHTLDKTRNQSGYDIPNTAIEAGIRTTRWPGRMEMLGDRLLLDVAHNPAGAWSLRAAIATLDEQRPRTLIFSCLRDKNLAEMSRILFPLFDRTDGNPLRRNDHIVLAPIMNVRAAAVEDLLLAARALGVEAHAAPHLEGALAQARQMTPLNGLMIATGSVYLVGEIRALLLITESVQ